MVKEFPFKRQCQVEFAAGKGEAFGNHRAGLFVADYHWGKLNLDPLLISNVGKRQELRLLKKKIFSLYE